MAPPDDQPKVRSRPFEPVAGQAIYRYTVAAGAQSTDQINRYDYRWSGSQVTESVGTPFLRSRKKGRSDLGSNFYTQKKTLSAPIGGFSASKRLSNVRTDTVTVRGPFLAINPANAAVDHSFGPHINNEAELDAAGATAIALVNPANPIEDLLTALVELRTAGLPSVIGSSSWKARTLTAKQAAGEYLNYQFGWKPLVNDVTGFTGVMGDASAVIEQYRRGIGVPTRRTFDFPTVTDSKSETIGMRSPYVNAPSSFRNGLSQGLLSRETVKSQHRWFVGCFTYYFPSDILGSKRLGDLAILGKQLGLEPTPEVMWNAAPWSWAADWFSNTGDVVTNWTRFNQDGLVMYYGYMMENTITKSVYSMSPVSHDTFGTLTPGSVVVTDEVKVRVRANPYGFGVKWSGLSPFQLSIMAALGISRT